jgi:hypothetical protein
VPHGGADGLYFFSPALGRLTPSGCTQRPTHPLRYGCALLSGQALDFLHFIVFQDDL